MLRALADSAATSGDEKLGSLRYHEDDVDGGKKAQLISNEVLVGVTQGGDSNKK